MNDNTIRKMLDMNYDACCNFLKKKYGIITKNYFTNENCKYDTKSIKRLKNEGLFIHHIDEDKAIMLSVSEYAVKNPFEYQLASRLVYCNYLEHLVLHIKIMQYPHKNKNENEIVGFGGAFNYIIPELNDIYSGMRYKAPWKQKCVEVILDKYDDYLLCLKFLIEHFDIDLKFYLISFNAFWENWSNKNNQKIYDEITKIYQKCKL